LTDLASINLNPRSSLTVSAYFGEDETNEARTNSIISHCMIIDFSTLNMWKCKTMTNRSLTDVVIDKNLVIYRINVGISCKTSYKFLVRNYTRSINNTYEQIMSESKRKHILGLNSKHPSVIENVVCHCYVIGIVYVDAVGLAVDKGGTNNRRSIVSVYSVEEHKSRICCVILSSIEQLYSHKINISHSMCCSIHKTVNYHVKSPSYIWPRNYLNITIKVAYLRSGIQLTITIANGYRTGTKVGIIESWGNSQ